MRRFFRALLRNRLVLIGLVLVALCGTLYIILSPPDGVRDSAPPPQVNNNTPMVVVATTVIPARTVVTAAMVAVRPATAADAKDYAAGVEEVVNHLSRKRFAQGDKIRRGDFTEETIEALGITALLNPGERAKILPLRHKPNPFEMVHPGDRVDLIASFEDTYSVTLLEDVRVLAVDLIADSDASIARATPPPAADAPAAPPTPPREPNITLAVTPMQAELLALAGDANIDVVLRPRDTSEVVRVSKGMVKKDVFPRYWALKHPSPPPAKPALPPPVSVSKVAPIVPPPQEPPTYTVEIIVGGSRKTVELPKQ